MNRTVRLDAPVEASVLFDYLSNLTRRPEWQASLRSIDRLDGDGRVGTTWQDVTAAGARPDLRVTVFERPYAWAERGRWRGLRAHLRLELLGYAPDRTRLTATYRITGRGLFALPAAVLQLLAGPAIASDLRRAVRLAGQS